MINDQDITKRMKNVRVSKKGSEILSAAVRALDVLDGKLRENVQTTRSMMFDTQRLIRWVEDGKSFNDFDPAKSDAHGSKLDKTANKISRLAQQRKRLIFMLETLKADEVYDLSLDDLASLGIAGLVTEETPEP